MRSTRRGARHDTQPTLEDAALVRVFPASEAQSFPGKVGREAAELLSKSRLLRGESSNGLLQHLGPLLRQHGFRVEMGKSAGGRVTTDLGCRVDALHGIEGCIVEVEAGRGAMSNAVDRNILRLLRHDSISSMITVVPKRYWYVSGGRLTSCACFSHAEKILRDLYDAKHFHTAKTVVLVGYDLTEGDRA